MLQVKSAPQVSDSVRRGLHMTYVRSMVEGGCRYRYIFICVYPRCFCLRGLLGHFALLISFIKISTQDLKIDMTNQTTDVRCGCDFENLCHLYSNFAHLS